MKYSILIIFSMLLGSAKAQVNDTSFLHYSDSAWYKFDTTAAVVSYLSFSNDSKWYYTIYDSSGSNILKYSEDTLIVHDSLLSIKELIKAIKQQYKSNLIYTEYLRDRKNMADDLIEEIRLLYNKDNNIDHRKLQKIYDVFYIKSGKRADEYYDSLKELTINN